MDKSLTEISLKLKVEEAKLDQIWGILVKYEAWDSLMGCSIQSESSANSKPEVQ